MLQEVCDVLKESYKRNWITSRDGNVSVRYAKQNTFFITPSGVRKQDLTPDLFSFREIQLVDSDWIDAGWMDITENTYRKPSGEIALHAKLQKNANNQDRVVLHLHPTYTIAAMYHGHELNKLCQTFPELFRYTKVAPNVGELPPMGQKLANACYENIGNTYDIVGITNHGVVAIGETPWDAFEHVERLEHICKILMIGSKK